MKTALIAPISLFKTTNFTEDKYHLLLAHLVDTHPEYASFYKELSQQGHHILLDNSVHELGEPGSADFLVRMAKRVGASEIALPDTPFHCNSTLRSSERAVEIIRKHLPQIKLMGIPQGHDIDDLLDCMQGLQELGIDTIGLTNDYEVWGGGLLKLIRQIRRCGHDQPIHILGWSRDLYALAELGRFSKEYNIYGVDSAKPFVYAYYSMLLSASPFEQAFKYPGRPKDYFNLPEEAFDIRFVKQNIQTFKTLAEGKIRSKYVV
jgi:hypothetical protein